MPEIIAPFYAGQRVVAVDAVPGSMFKNGKEYTVAACEYKANPVNGLWFWYIGIIGHDNGSAWYRPWIFAPMEEAFEAIEFTEAIKNELSSVN